MNPEAIGQGFEVFIDIDLTNFSAHRITQFERSMTDHKETLELHRLFGSPDYQARVATSSLKEYERFLTDHILAIPGISRVSSRFALKTVKSLRPPSRDQSH